MIHWPRVKELRDEIGAEDFGEVVDLFLEEVEEVIVKLRSGDCGHFLKGSAMNLGFDDFSKLCLVGERKSAEGQAENVNVPEILDQFESSKVAFLAKLPSLN
jgi:HPt (histidine-containing phosphotransfer) domain-containing protein